MCVCANNSNRHGKAYGKSSGLLLLSLGSGPCAIEGGHSYLTTDRTNLTQKGEWARETRELQLKQPFSTTSLETSVKPSNWQCLLSPVLASLSPCSICALFLDSRFCPIKWQLNKGFGSGFVF